MQTLVGAHATLTWVAAGTGVATLTVVLPDGTTLSPPPTVTTTDATHTATITATQPGRYALAWARDAVRAADILDVWPADPHYLISVDEAIEAIKAGGSAPASVRDDMPLFIAAASLVIEDLCGPLVPATRTHKADGGRPVVLPATHVEVESVVVSGLAADLAMCDVDDVAGIVYVPAPRGFRNVTVTYKVGTEPLPANLRLACMEQLRFLWQTMRQGRGRAVQELGYTPSGYAVPYMVIGLCASHPAAPGFA